ncbi:MAG: polysaccharide export protein [Nitrospinae bacterium]|nr:polysaccharide export protein [Nitrospinota bacterium]
MNILVYRHSDLSFSSTYVRMDGQIGMPLIGDVKVEGLTVPEARETLEKLYATYIVNPRIVVAVNKAGSQKIYVLGEVNTPGMIKIDDRISLLQAILRSNGVNRDANISEVLVVRKGKAYKLSLKKVLEGDSSQDVAMLNGDIVYVPPTTISDISRSMAYITTILSPFTQVEGGIILAPQVEEVLRGSSKSSSTSISIPAN